MNSIVDNWECPSCGERELFEMNMNDYPEFERVYLCRCCWSAHPARSFKDEVGSVAVGTGDWEIQCPNGHNVTVGEALKGDSLICPICHESRWSGADI